MLSAAEQMIQLMAYNQLLMPQLTNVQEEPLDLSLPKKSKRSLSCLGLISPEKSTFPSKSRMVTDNSPKSEIHSMLPHSPVSVADSNPSDCSSDGDSSYIGEVKCPVRQGKPLLWYFLYNLLENSRFHEVIWWLDRSAGLFVIRHPDLLAKMWGQCKSNPNMTFECLSRSLRAYYQKGIISKKSRLQYQFSSQALMTLQQNTGSKITETVP